MHYDSGQSHETAGDYTEARHQYCGAMSRAERADVPKATMSMLTYDCGRTSEYLCDFPTAEKYLLKSLELQKEVSSTDSKKLAPRMLELARLYFDQRNYAESAKYYAMGISNLDSLGVEKHDPLAYADALDEYGDMLAHVGQAAESSIVKAKARSLRENHQGAMKHFVPVRCKSTR